MEVKTSKPAWRTSGPSPVKLLAHGFDEDGNHLYYAHRNLNLERQVTPAFWLATSILLLVYLIISLEWLHRTLAALLGATMMLFISCTLGACLGGNGTVIGASANVVTVGLAERAGCRISFLGYMQACFFPMLITVAICMVYLPLRY